jgi:hypothetical protein
MSNPGNIELHKTTYLRLNTNCSRCNRTRNHHILTSLLIDEEKEVECYGNYETHAWTIEYQSIQCLHCKLISFRAADSDWNSLEGLISEEIYDNFKEILPIEEIEICIKNIKMIYIDALSNAVKGERPILSNINIWTILQEIDREPHDRTLEEKINNIKNRCCLTDNDARIFSKILFVNSNKMCILNKLN